MNNARIVEVVLWNTTEGIAPEEAKTAAKTLNNFVQQQSGFVARKTAVAEDGQFLDLVYWTDLASAKAASAKAMQATELRPIFGTMEQSTMFLKHFELFNQLPQ